MQAEVLSQPGQRVEPVASPPRRFTMAILLAAVAASSGITVIYTVLVTLYKAFPASSYVSWTVTAYWLGSAVFAAVSGRLGDLLGYRRILLVVMSIAAAGAVVAACANHVGMLIAGCAMQSIAAGITPLSIGLVRENLPPARLPAAVGLISAAGMVSAGLVYICAGVVVDHYSWQGGFWFKVALCIVAVVAVRAWAPPSPRRAAPAYGSTTFVAWHSLQHFAPSSSRCNRSAPGDSAIRDCWGCWLAGWSYWYFGDATNTRRAIRSSMCAC